MSSGTSFHFRQSVGTPLLAALLAACASEPPQPVTIEDTQEVSATVEAIDVNTRMISLRGSDGDRVTVQATPEVQNLAQVNVGDRVVARYHTALAAELRRRGDGSGETEAPVVETEVGRAAAGDRPAASVGTKSRQTVRITNVDKKNNVVNFYGSDGLTRSVPIRTPQGQEFISKLKAGDEVEITYTEAVAVSVEPK